MSDEQQPISLAPLWSDDRIHAEVYEWGLKLAGKGSLKVMRDEYEADRQATRTELASLKRSIEDLTPGGSEFHDSPTNCLAWLKARMSTVMKVAAENNRMKAALNEANAKIAALEAQLDALQERAIGDGTASHLFGEWSGGGQQC